MGIVSDFDLLVFDIARRDKGSSLFPKAEDTWQAFKQVKAILSRGSGKK